MFTFTLLKNFYFIFFIEWNSYSFSLSEIAHLAFFCVLLVLLISWQRIERLFFHPSHPHVVLHGITYLLFEWRDETWLKFLINKNSVFFLLLRAHRKSSKKWNESFHSILFSSFFSIFHFTNQQKKDEIEKINFCFVLSNFIVMLLLTKISEKFFYKEKLWKTLTIL